MNNLQKVCVSLSLALANACTAPAAMMDDVPDVVDVADSGTADRPDVPLERDVASMDMDAVTLDVPSMDASEPDVSAIADVADSAADVPGCAVGTTACGMMGCFDLQSSNSHCGACGMACPVGSRCQAGTCTCNMGTTLCAGECVDSMNDTNHCGGCGIRCPGAQLCVAGACRVDCPAPNRICGAGALMRCVNLQSDVGNCGACAMACALANSTPSCTNGMCAVASCNAGFGNCDMSAANGCETNTNDNVAHCGRCGMACAVANGVPACAAGMCAVGSCNAGFGNCDMNAANGCETNTSNNPLHCGRCALVCPAVANGTPACTAGVCTSTCNMGFPPIAGQCLAPGAFPRPIAPLSLGDVSLRRPTLRWELPAGADGAVVDLCRDRACTMVIETIRAMGTSARPMLPLPAKSVVFWRLRASAGGSTAMTYSPTWLFHVPATDNSGGIDTSSNAHLDLNGDGFDDVVVGASSADPGGRSLAGTASVYHGTAMGIPMVAVRVLEGTAASDQFGYSVSGAGDVNGDGFGDLIVGSLGASPGGRLGAGTASVFLGSAMGIGMAPARVLEGSAVDDRFGSAVSSAGDVNGDGYGDLVVGSVVADRAGVQNCGTASVYHGSAMGIPMVAARVLEGTAVSDQLGSSVSGAGDVNGDGFSDLIVGTPGADPGGRSGAGTASVFLGSAMGIGMAPARVLEGSAADDRFGVAVSSAGDVNGDGYGDLVVGSLAGDRAGVQDCGTASVYHGSAMGIPMAAARVLEGTALNDVFGFSVSSAGDVNGDGFGDLIVGGPNADPGGRVNAGTASVYHGSAMGIPMAAARVLEGTAANDQFGFSVSGAGDVNGDGFSDLIVGTTAADPGGRISAGTASVYHGGVLGVSVAAARVLEGTAADDQFGHAVASADRRQMRTAPNRLWLALARSLRVHHRL